MKKAFTLIEIILVIVISSIFLSLAIPKYQISNLDEAANRVILYLKHTRYLAMVDNKYNPKDGMWYKQRWTLKFRKCSSSIGGLYFLVYSDTNKNGHISKNECAKDPITSRYLYSNWDCKASSDESKYILLTKEYGVRKVDISCNSTSTIGSFSFGENGDIYSRLGIQTNEIEKYKLIQKCYLKLYDKTNKFIEIIIEPQTGYIYKK